LLIIRQTTTFSKVYGITSSSNYTVTLQFDPRWKTNTVTIDGNTYSLPASSSFLSIPRVSLAAANNNTLSINSPIPPTSLTITPPPPTFYSSTSFTPTGNATRVTCYTGLCTPVGSKISNLSPTGSASLSLTPPSSSSLGPKFIEVLFCNNDIALSTSWGYGTNTRNMTISVNDVVTRIEVPLSGRSSELFSPADGWEDTGTFGVLVGGWVEGVNEVRVGNVYGDEGLVAAGADFVGLSVLW
jgi:alpha-galactosidase